MFNVRSLAKLNTESGQETRTRGTIHQSSIHVIEESSFLSNPAIAWGHFQCFLMRVPSSYKCGGLRQEGIWRKTFFAKSCKRRNDDKYILDRSNPDHQQPPQVSHGRAPVETITLLGLVASEQVRKASEEAVQTVEGEMHSHKNGYL